MEMPIQVIITLFVVLVVGILVLIFSQNILESSEKSIKKIGLEKSPEDVAVEVVELTNSEIAKLAENCDKQNFGGSIQDRICFFVHSQAPFNLSDSGVYDETGLDEQGRLFVGNATNIKSVIIKWNAADAKVEVTA